MHVVVLIVLGVWVIFWIYWFISAATAKPGRRRWGSGAPVRIVLIVAWVVFVRLAGIKSTGNGIAPWLTGIGVALFVAGLALAVWARLYIGRNWGSPMSQKDDPELVTTGPYQTIRHPIYTGIIAAMIGTALAASLWGLIAVAVLAGFFIFSAFTEERNMAKTFPDTYPAYKASTKMLIPFVF